jgi:hypothetical protein
MPRSAPPSLMDFRSFKRGFGRGYLSVFEQALYSSTAVRNVAVSFVPRVPVSASGADMIGTNPGSLIQSSGQSPSSIKI